MHRICFLQSQGSDLPTEMQTTTDTETQRHRDAQPAQSHRHSITNLWKQRLSTNTQTQDANTQPNEITTTHTTSAETPATPRHGYSDQGTLPISIVLTRRPHFLGGLLGASAAELPPNSIDLPATCALKVTQLGSIALV